MDAEWLSVGPELDARTAAARIRAKVPAAASVAPAVAAIVEAVRAGGDAAVQRFTSEFDRVASPRPLRMAADEVAAAVDALDPELRAGLERAIANVTAVAAAGVGADAVDVDLPEGHRVVLREEPVRRAAVYAPGGRYPYPSSVVMGVATARAAGVETVAVCAPPGPDGEAQPVIAGAAGLAGADVVYRMGGAQAIGALAHGTESVEAVDVIVGPGNLYVAEAKRQVFGTVGIDGPAGPSDLLVVASEGASPALIALDLLAQAEHGPGTPVVVVAADEQLLEDVAVEVGSRLKARATVSAEAVMAFVHTPDLAAARDVAEHFAPEHLSLQGADAEALAPAVRAAGCLFVGGAGAVAFGDYVAGSNHVLPTAGAASWASGLSARAFRRRFSEVRVGPEAAARLAPAGVAIARAEGFAVHGESMAARVRDHGGRS